MVGCSPHLCSQRPEVRPLCTSRVVVACCSEGLFLADSILVWLPKTFLMNLDQQNPTAFQDLRRQKLSKTNFLLFLEVPFPAPMALRQRKYQSNMQV